MTTCPICRDTGIAHSAPYMMGTAQGARKFILALPLKHPDREGGV